MDAIIEKNAENSLIWYPELEIGFCHADESIYNEEYFDEYIRRENSPIAKSLNEFRIELVNKYTQGIILDIGIGCGTLLKLRGNCLGYDINPKAVELLKRFNLYFNPYVHNFNGVQGGHGEGIDGVAFFDSLEHIRKPGKILERLSNQFVFVSIPIFRDLDHLLGSKHFKRYEHYYYFTEKSFIRFMEWYDFRPIEIRDDEIRLGREDIKTFIFGR